MAHGKSAFVLMQEAMDREAKILVSDDELLSAMRAWTLSDVFMFNGMSEGWKKRLRRAVAEVVKRRLGRP